MLKRADAYADSAYFCNINGRYQRTLEMADSARTYLNRYYLSVHPDGKYLMVSHPKKERRQRFSGCTTVCLPTTM